MTGVGGALGEREGRTSRRRTEGGRGEGLADGSGQWAVLLGRGIRAMTFVIGPTGGQRSATFLTLAKISRLLLCFNLFGDQS